MTTPNDIELDLPPSAPDAASSDSSPDAADTVTASMGITITMARTIAEFIAAAYADHAFNTRRKPIATPLRLACEWALWTAALELTALSWLWRGMVAECVWNWFAVPAGAWPVPMAFFVALPIVFRLITTPPHPEVLTTDRAVIAWAQGVGAVNNARIATAIFAVAWLAHETYHLLGGP